MTRLVLASASPVRLRLLQAAGIEPEVVISGVDESAVTGRPAEVARELARRKARAVVTTVGDDSIVLGCDSVLDLDGQALGKPGSAQEAVDRWMNMRGRTGHLVTGHCVIVSDTGREVYDVASTVVRFGSPSDAEISAYVATGEPLGVAGAFTLDGFGGWFVDSIDGDHSNVLGLSLPLLRRLLALVGVPVTSLWHSPSPPWDG